MTCSLRTWAAVLVATTIAPAARAAEQPIAIFHAFHQRLSDIEKFVCALHDQGYSHVQIPPAQKSSDAGDEWYFRYQPVDFGTLEGRGGEGEAELVSLIAKADTCDMKVIADVVFNHMTSNPNFNHSSFPGLTKDDFHGKCDINYNDDDNWSELWCWLNGDLPDLAHDAHQPGGLLS